MENGDQKLPLTKKDSRPDSEFFAREFLYDLVNSTLDPARREAVDKAVAENRELQEDVARIREAVRYADHLSATGISEDLLEQIDEPETYLSVLLKKTNYERWPLAVKWGLEALVVLSALLLVLIIVPWDKALKWGLSPRGREVILAEMSRPSRTEIEVTAGGEEHQGENLFEDEGTQVAKKTAPAPAAPTPSPAAKTPEPAKPPSAPAPSAPAAAAVATTTPAETEKKSKGEGALYRGNMYVTNVGVTSTKIRDKIIELGGRKAGEVELGWRKTPTSSYFHFTMPEAKYEELQKFLADYGKSDLHKEKHPRVMPDGIIRLILSVEEARK